MSIAVAIANALELLVLQDWDTLRSNVLSDPALFRNICSAIAACSELNGMTLLHAALRFNPPLDIVAQMIRICPYLTAVTDCLKRTPLHVAAGCKASASLIKLIARAYPAACVAQDEEGKTPLHLACDSSCVLFEDQNDDVDENDASTSKQESPNHKSIVALLSISLHATTLEDEEEMSPLEHAIMSNASLKTVKLLQAATRKGYMQIEKEKETQSPSFMTAMSRLKVQDDSTPDSDACCFSSRPRKMARRITP
jgi:ankyrin repeat protein